MYLIYTFNNFPTFYSQMVTIVDPHIKRDDDYHIHRVSFLYSNQPANKSVYKLLTSCVCTLCSSRKQVPKVTM